MGFEFGGGECWLWDGEALGITWKVMIGDEVDDFWDVSSHSREYMVL